jgi:hypothetical protein
MIKAHGDDDGVIMPEDLEMLQRVFDAAIARMALDKHAPEASILATRLMHLFLRGVRNEEDLRLIIAA